MQIRWTQPAVRDLTNICDYIEEQDTAATARRVALIIYRSVTSLNKFPHRGRPGRKTETRELVIANLPYIAVYRVRESVVEVVRILHGAQDWP
jgi:addiction module RelE/StbE family toxin